MLRLNFFAVLDELTESVVSIFYARSFEHAKLIVKNSFKDSNYDVDLMSKFKLIMISDTIKIDNDYDSIVKNHLNVIKDNDIPDDKIDFFYTPVLDILNNKI